MAAGSLTTCPTYCPKASSAVICRKVVVRAKASSRCCTAAGGVSVRKGGGLTMQWPPRKGHSRRLWLDNTGHAAWRHMQPQLTLVPWKKMPNPPVCCFASVGPAASAAPAAAAAAAASACPLSEYSPVVLSAVARVGLFPPFSFPWSRSLQYRRYASRRLCAGASALTKAGWRHGGCQIVPPGVLGSVPCRRGMQQRLAALPSTP